MPNFDVATLGKVMDRFPDVAFRSGFAKETPVCFKRSHQDQFASEAAGLDALGQTNSIRVAKVIGVGQAESKFVLVLELIGSRIPNADFFERFARQLAETHRAGSADQFGFEHDNFLGETFQPNPWTVDWVEFWSESRLSFQLKLARDNGFGGNDLQRLGVTMLGRLDSLIGASSEQPALIHGDLWSGNWLCDRNHQPVLIDPAAYYANREAEFGMTTLFSGLPNKFYDAYQEVWPMESGWRDRVAIYRLYHLLNHLNLFGTSYLSDCLAILRKFA